MPVSNQSMLVATPRMAPRLVPRELTLGVQELLGKMARSETRRRQLRLVALVKMDQTRVDSTSPKVWEAPPSDPPTTKTGARPTTQTAPAYPPCSTYYSPALVRGPPGRRRRWAGSSRSEVELPCVWLTERRPARSRLSVEKLPSARARCAPLGATRPPPSATFLPTSG